jgi:hypothetical protein
LVRRATWSWWRRTRFSRARSRRDRNPTMRLRTKRKGSSCIRQDSNPAAWHAARRSGPTIAALRVLGGLHRVYERAARAGSTFAALQPGRKAAIADEATAAAGPRPRGGAPAVRSRWPIHADRVGRLARGHDAAPSRGRRKARNHPAGHGRDLRLPPTNRPRSQFSAPTRSLAVCESHAPVGSSPRATVGRLTSSSLRCVADPTTF